MCSAVIVRILLSGTVVSAPGAVAAARRLRPGRRAGAGAAAAGAAGAPGQPGAAGGGAAGRRPGWRGCASSASERVMRPPMPVPVTVRGVDAGLVEQAADDRRQQRRGAGRPQAAAAGSAAARRRGSAGGRAAAGSGCGPRGSGPARAPVLGLLGLGARLRAAGSAAAGSCGRLGGGPAPRRRRRASRTAPRPWCPRRPCRPPRPGSRSR